MTNGQALDFTLDDACENIRQLVHWFSETELRPVALQADRDHAFPEAVLRKMVEYGFVERQTASEHTKDKGGQSLTARASIVGSEEFAWGDPSAVLSLPGPGLGGPPVRIMGTPEQKQRFLGIFSDREKLHYGAYALTEPGAGTDAANIQTTAVKDGNHYVVNGSKCFITNGAKADWVVVFATVDKAAGKAGHRVFVVEKGTPGFRVGKLEEKMGLRASETAELVFTDCRVHADNLLGGEGYYERAGKGGFVGAMKTFDATRPMVGAMAVGIARAVYEIARDFVKENYVLARPIPRYTLLAQKLARTDRRVRAARLLCWQAGYLADVGVPNTREASIAKAYAAQVATKACADAIQIVGATGTTQALLVEKFFRDIKVYDIFEGTAQAQRIVIAKRIIEGLSAF